MKSTTTDRVQKIAFMVLTVLSILLLSGCPQNLFFGLEADPRDDEGPEITIINPSDGQILSGLLVVTGVATDKYEITSIKARLNNENPVLLEGTTAWYYVVDTTSLLEGEHTVTIIGQDQFRNVSQKSVSFVVDQTVPNVNVTDPDLGVPNSNWVRGTNVVLQGSATDDNEVERVEVSFDGVRFESATYSPATGTWTYTIADTGHIIPGDGSVLVYLRAWDNAANPGSTNFSLFIDNTPPEVSIDDPTAETLINADEVSASYIPSEGTLRVSGTATSAPVDGQFAMDRVTITVSAGTTQLDPVELPLSGPSFQADLDITTIQNEGAGTIRVTARDRAGNETTEEIPVAFDTNPPEIGGTITTGKGTVTAANLNVPQNNFTAAEFVFEGDVTRPVGGADLVDLQVRMVRVSTSEVVFDYTTDGTTAIDAAGGAWSFATNFSGSHPGGEPYTEGVYDLSFKVTNENGGFDVATRRIRLDFTAPVAIVTDPTGSAGNPAVVGQSTEFDVSGSVNIAGGSPVTSIRVVISDGVDVTFTSGEGWDDDRAGRFSFSPASGAFVYRWNNDTLPTGVPYTATFTATDMADNEASGGSVGTTVMEIDPNAPVISFVDYRYTDDDAIEPYEDALIPGRFVNSGGTITGTAVNPSNSDLSDPEIVELAININEEGWVEIPIAPAPSVPWEFTLSDYTPLTLAHGETYTIRVRAVDNDGDGVTNVRSTTVTVDNDRPLLSDLAASLTDDSGTPYLHGLVEITGSVSDAASGLESVFVGVDGGEGQDLEELETVLLDGPFLVEWDTEASPTRNGTNPIIAKDGIVVRAVARDQAGNVSVASLTRNVRPYVATIDRSSALLGDPVVISGNNLGDGTAGNTTVTVGGGAVTVAAASLDELSVAIPAYDENDFPPDSGLSSGPVIVEYNGVSNAAQEPVRLNLFYLREVANIGGNRWFPASVYDQEAGDLLFAYGASGGQPPTRHVYYRRDGEDEELVQQSNSVTHVNMARGPDPDDPLFNPDRTYISYAGEVAGGGDPGVYIEASTSDDWSPAGAADPDNYLVGPGGTYNDIAVDDLGRLHVVYYAGGSIYYARIDDGLTSPPAAASVIPDVTASVEAWVALAVDTEGNPHVVYRGSDNTRLRYVHHNGTAWSIPATVATGNPGRFGNAIGVGEDDSIHIVYSDTSAGEIWYARAASAGGAFVRTLIDGESNNQRFPSIAIDNENYAHITYLDTNFGVPMYVRGSTDGLLLTEIVDSTATTGNAVDFNSTATVIADGVVYMIYINANNGLQAAVYLP
ncbi:MAG: hypothetical protein EA404_07920 [Spirochaetaceae bacterium]|nr:MAG: hypothetical protein EA404_07920 [Spirochaetaceae bacterium]